MLFVVIDDKADRYLDELIAGIRRCCPRTGIAWFDTGPADSVRSPAVERIPSGRPLRYAKITPAFFEIFEWVLAQRADVVVTVETDMAFLDRGFTDLLDQLIRYGDYFAFKYFRNVQAASKWRPYRSLQPELPELLDILRVERVDRAFSPAQAFSRRYLENLLAASFYPRLRAFVERNQQPGRSFTLQEVLLPTLVRALGLRGSAYPARRFAQQRAVPTPIRDRLQLLSAAIRH
jgi:hypothetical protein